MSSITVKLDQEVNFVLADENEKVVAIIKVPQGTTDIDNKLASAIADDTGDSFQYFQTDVEINLETSSREIEILTYLEDEAEERYLVSFYLIKTEIY